MPCKPLTLCASYSAQVEKMEKVVFRYPMNWHLVSSPVNGNGFPVLGWQQVVFMLLRAKLLLPGLTHSAMQPPRGVPTRKQSALMRWNRGSCCYTYKGVCKHLTRPRKRCLTEELTRRLTRRLTLHKTLNKSLTLAHDHRTS